MLRNARAFFAKVLTPLAAALARAGVTPNAITVLGTLGVVVSALVCFPQGWLLAGAWLVTFFVLLDMVDGAVARASGGGTLFGAVLDSTGDRLADAAIFGGIAWYFASTRQFGLLAAALLCLVLGSLTSYIRARAEAAGLTASVGIAERPERMIAGLVGIGLDGFGLPYVMAVLLWALVGASAVTVGQRIVAVYRQTVPLTRGGPAVAEPGERPAHPAPAP